MGKVKMLVACHKPSTVFQDDVYIPIHVGKALSSYQMNMIGDDTGDNISVKNPMYCELTAEYWGWKNLNDIEYIGLCHYRRYFETKITNDNIVDLLGNKYDVMLVDPMIIRYSAGTHLLYGVSIEDISIFVTCIKEIYPEYYHQLCSYLKSNKLIPYNMFVMKKSLFDQFAEWQFSVLNSMEKYVKLSNYTRMRRVYGYIGEVLLPLWCKCRELRIRYDGVIPMIGEKCILSWKDILSRNFNRLAFQLQLANLNWINSPSVVVGLQNDGIYDEFGLLEE